VPILRVFFTSLEVQRLAALHSNEIVIAMLLTRNPMGLGLPLAPPPPSSSSGGGSFGGNGGGGSGFAGGCGFGGGNFGSDNCGMYGGGLGGGGSSSGIGGGGRGGVGGRTIGGGGSATFVVAPTRTFSPQKKQFVPSQVVNVTYADLPSAQNAFMDYTKHVDAGLAGKAWCHQTRERKQNKRAKNNPLLGGKGEYYVTNSDVEGVKTGDSPTNTTGTITPDLSLGLGGGKNDGQ
jgi:hypothetical protein